MDLTLLKSFNYPATIKSVPIIDVREKLPVNPKYSWKTYVPKDGSRKNGIRDLMDLKTVVLHHDAISKASTKEYSDLTLMTNIAKSHINTKRNIPGGDGGMPYHAFVRNGKVYICNDITDFTFGVSGNNGYTVHIAVSGNYAANDSLSDADKLALEAGVLLLEANMPAFVNVKAHKELSATKCPAYDYEKIRKEIAAIKLAASMDGTPNDKMARVYSLRTRVEDLYKTATTPGKYQETAQNILVELYETLKARNLI